MLDILLHDTSSFTFSEINKNKKYFRKSSATLLNADNLHEMSKPVFWEK